MLDKASTFLYSRKSSEFTWCYINLIRDCYVILKEPTALVPVLLTAQPISQTVDSTTPSRRTCVSGRRVRSLRRRAGGWSARLPAGGSTPMSPRLRCRRPRTLPETSAPRPPRRAAPPSAAAAARRCPPARTLASGTCRRVCTRLFLCRPAPSGSSFAPFLTPALRRPSPLPPPALSARIPCSTGTRSCTACRAMYPSPMAPSWGTISTSRNRNRMNGAENRR
mmetsp:Transcript_23221/g.58680  ORF Transcript_23221/g.58680 Transcript_23221/m.58680 type:complete len:223 (-) Transcript_23221:1458-2126(-)